MRCGNDDNDDHYSMHKSSRATVEEHCAEFAIVNLVDVATHLDLLGISTDFARLSVCFLDGPSEEQTAGALRRAP